MRSQLHSRSSRPICAHFSWVSFFSSNPYGPAHRSFSHRANSVGFCLVMRSRSTAIVILRMVSHLPSPKDTSEIPPGRRLWLVDPTSVNFLVPSLSSFSPISSQPLFRGCAWTLSCYSLFGTFLIGPHPKTTSNKLGKLLLPSCRKFSPPSTHMLVHFIDTFKKDILWLGRR